MSSSEFSVFFLLNRPSNWSNWCKCHLYDGNTTTMYWRVDIMSFRVVGWTVGRKNVRIPMDTLEFFRHFTLRVVSFQCNWWCDRVPQNAEKKLWFHLIAVLRFFRHLNRSTLSPSPNSMAYCHRIHSGEILQFTVFGVKYETFFRELKSRANLRPCRHLCDFSQS